MALNFVLYISLGEKSECFCDLSSKQQVKNCIFLYLSQIKEFFYVHYVLTFFVLSVWLLKEDDAIVELVKLYGTKKWTFVANKLESKFKIRTRTGK